MKIVLIIDTIGRSAESAWRNRCFGQKLFAFFPERSVMQGTQSLRPCYGKPATLAGYSGILALGLWLISLTATGAAGLVSPLPGSPVGWGENRFGEANPPVGLTNVIAVSAGLRHSLALNGDGTVTGFGRSIFFFSDPLSNVVAIAAGTRHSLALRADGTVAAGGTPTGTGSNSTTSVPAGLSNVIAVAAGDRFNLALREDGTVVGWGSPYAIPPSTLSNVIAISSGPFHALALKADGTVVGWGLREPTIDQGQISPPAGLSNVVAIAAGAYHSLALTSDGTLHGWGRNLEGQLNTPDGLSNVVAISAGALHSVALTGDGQMVAWGGNEFGQTNVPRYLIGQTLGISAGYYHSLALSRGPVILTNPVPQTVPAGTNIQFTVTASGIGQLSYQWQFNGNDIPGETNDLLVLNTVRTNDSGDYTIVVTNFAGVASNTAALIVPIAPGIFAQPLGQTVMVGTDVTLSVSATGFPTPTFRWRWNGAILAGATNRSLILTNVQRSQRGEYSVVVTNAGGSVTSANALLSVLQQASIPPENIAPSYNAGVGFSFNLRLQTGADYGIQRSTDLLHWYDITNFHCTASEMVFKDSPDPSRPQAFYRIVSPYLH